MRGLLNEATTVYRQALRWATASGQQPPLAAGTIYIGNALLLYERNDVDAALDQAQQGLALGLRSGEMKTLFPGYLALAQIHQGLGDLARAWHALEDAERLADFHFFSWTEEEVAAARVRLLLAQGEIGLAVRVLSRDGWQIEGEQAIPFSVYPPSIQLAWARVLLAQHRPAAALLQRVLDGYRRERPQASTLPIVVLHALALAASGADEQARSAGRRLAVRQRCTPIGALRPSLVEQVDHACLDRKPGQGVDGFDGHKHCPWVPRVPPARQSSGLLSITIPP